MRKIRLLALCFLLSAFLGACGVGGSDAEEYESYIIEEIACLSDYEFDTDEDECTPEYVYFLKDLDYMLYALENNFALFDVAYWARDADIAAIIENVRVDVLSNPEMEADDFLTSMVYNFSPLRGVAHFMIELPNSHTIVINNTDVPASMMLTENTLARWHYPHVMNFYRSRLRLGNWSGERPMRIEGSARRLARLDRFILFGKYDEVDEINYALTQGNYDEAVRKIMNLGRNIDLRPNVTAEILKEDRIAYVSIDSFQFRNDPSSDEWYSDKEKIHSFFEGIRDYEHLIIDIRRNEGGIPRFFEDVILRPIIDEAVQVAGLAFATRGYYSLETLDSVTEGTSFIPCTIGAFIGPADNRLRSISAMLEEFYLPELNMYDMERMDYGFPIHMERLYPKRLERFDFQSAFGGNIWLLTSDVTGSAAQINAWLSKESDFATHVGETTGGNFGGPRTAVALPNSGMIFRMDVLYVTDEHGRPLEAGTVPHHFNREGMDALETTLELIAEGIY